MTITIDTDAPAAPAVPVITDSVSQITGGCPMAKPSTIRVRYWSGTGTPNDVITIYDSVDGGTPAPWVPSR